MASLSVEEVIERLFNEDSEEGQQMTTKKEDDHVGLDSWLDTFPNKEGFNRELFKDITKEVLKPIVEQCSVRCDHGELQPTERLKGKMTTLFRQ